MNKILLIIQREYLSRVKKKSFIWMTLLVPVLFIGMYSLLIYTAVKGDELGDLKTVLVVDESGLVKDKLKNTTNITFAYSTKTYADERSGFKDSKYNYLLRLPATLSGAQILGEKKPGASLTGNIESQVNELLKNKKLLDAGIDINILKEAEKGINIEALQITDEGEKEANAMVAYGLGFIAAILIYMSLFIYGAQVMRGVIEEKTSRVIEVIISSVKPFQLMLGKIIGVGMVGLTQFILWIVISGGLIIGAGAMLGSGKTAELAQTQQVSAGYAPGAPNTVQIASATDSPDKLAKLQRQLADIPVGYTLGIFLFYFIFGYLIYSAVFAAVGSAVDNETETQQFMIPITLPLIFTFAFSLGFIINNPDSSISVWLSMIPLTSPIAMMVRLQYDVPAWQLITSMALLVGGFIFTTWVAARIYRVGILMYGKKVTYKELAKWFFYKE
ncbi:MAG: ABC transporter permease [Flavipsychrobacter sp.]|nr:ABC transporter permease [Flavipsychrobacter sp.]